MKKGLYVIRMLWKDADCYHFPPLDMTYYAGPPPVNPMYGQSPLEDIMQALIWDTPIPSFLDIQECVYQEHIAYRVEECFE